MNIRDLLDKIDTLSEAGETAPTSIVPTHFHKSNLGTSLPLMMTEPGIFWWEGSDSSDGDSGQRRGGGGRSIQRWIGNTENRSKWNPASVDGVYVNGKPVEFPEGVTWKTYKSKESAPQTSMDDSDDFYAKPFVPVAKPQEPEKQDTKTAVNTPISNSDHTAKLNALSLQLQDKLNSKKTDEPMKHQMGAILADPEEYEKFPKVGEEVYTIQKGDNLTRLATRFGTTVPELLKLNPDIKNPNLIYAGKDLKIPSGKPVADTAKKTQAFEGLMATALIESFGYDAPLDEYSLDQFGKDVGAGARGVGNGLTFGFGDNLVAGAKAGLGIEKDYKTALGKEMANTARAKANSTSGEFNNPFHNTWVGNKLGAEKTFKVNPYDVGDIVGTVAAPIPGSMAVKGVGKAGQLALGAGANVATAVGAGIAKNWHDEKSTGITQDLVNRLAKMNPELLKGIQTSLKIPATGKLDPVTLDAIGKQAKAAKDVKEARESQNKILSESEKMSALKNRLARINEGAPGSQTVARPIERLLGISGKDLAKMTDQEIANMIGFGAKLDRTPSGIIVPKTALPPKTTTKVEPTVTPKVEPTVKNTNTNTATGGTSSSTSAGGNAGVTGSGNSKNTINNSPVININIGAKELAAVERAVAHDAGPVVAKQLDDVLKTGDKAAIGGWWAKNKNKVKWTSGTLGVLGAVGLGGLLFGGKDDAQDMKPSDDPAVTTDPNAPVTTDPNAPVTTDPNVPGPMQSPEDHKKMLEKQAEVAALIAQMQELMLRHGDDESPAWGQATSNAQSLIDQAKGSKNTAQIALDKEAARRMPASKEVASTKPAADSEQGPERLGYGDDELQRIIKNSGGYEISTNKKDPIRVSGGTVIGPKADTKIGDYRLDPEGKAKLKAN